MARRFAHTYTHTRMVGNYYFPIDSRLYRDREHVLLRFLYTPQCREENVRILIVVKCKKIPKPDFTPFLRILIY